MECQCSPSALEIKSRGLREYDQRVGLPADIKKSGEASLPMHRKLDRLGQPSLPSEIKSETVEDAETGFSILNKKSHRSGAIQGMFLPLEKPARDLKASSQASIPMGEKFREVWKYVSKLSWLEQ